MKLLDIIPQAKSHDAFTVTRDLAASTQMARVKFFIELLRTALSHQSEPAIVSIRTSETLRTVNDLLCVRSKNLTDSLYWTNACFP